VLRGAEIVLPACLGVEVEVEFLPLDVGQPLFRDVDSHLAESGFELYDLRRDYYLREEPPPIPQKRGQIVYADALYFRDWRTIPQDRETLLRMAVLLLVYGYADVVTEILGDAASLTQEDRREVAEICATLTSAGKPLKGADKVLGTSFRFQ
jgi:hypothetical protein